MKKTSIKSLNEYFSQTLSGDGYNSSNGVFKVNYKPFSDLSIAVGRDPDPSLLIKDSRFQVGDFVKGNVQGKKKKISGEVIEITKAQDGKSYKIKIQSKRTKKAYSLIPGSIEFEEDRGNSTNSMGLTVSSKEKMAQNAKYNGGNVVWGSLENENTSMLMADPENNDLIDGPMGTGWKIKIEDELPSGNIIFNSAVIDPTSNLITSIRSNNIEGLKTRLKAIEAYCFMFYHPELNSYPIDLRTLIGIVFLELKNEHEAKKSLIQNFPDLSGRSYGESRDEHIEKAKEIINSFL